MVALCGAAILAKPYLPPRSTFRESFPKTWVRCLTRILRATRKDSKRSQKWNTGPSTFQKMEILGGNKVLQEPERWCQMLWLEGW